MNSLGMALDKYLTTEPPEFAYDNYFENVYELMDDNLYNEKYEEDVDDIIMFLMKHGISEITTATVCNEYLRNDNGVCS